RGTSAGVYRRSRLLHRGRYQTVGPPRLWPSYRHSFPLFQSSASRHRCRWSALGNLEERPRSNLDVWSTGFKILLANCSDDSRRGYIAGTPKVNTSIRQQNLKAGTPSFFICMLSLFRQKQSVRFLSIIASLTLAAIGAAMIAEAADRNGNYE